MVLIFWNLPKDINIILGNLSFFVVDNWTVTNFVYCMAIILEQNFV